MFEFNSVSIRNFMSISALDLDFDSESITLICGENGSGKSSLLMSLAFTIFNYKKADSFKDFVKVGEDEATIKLDATFKGYPITYDVTIKSTVTRDVTYKGVTYHNSDYENFMKDEGLTDVQNLMFLMNNGTSLVDMKPTERANTLKSLFHIDFSSQVESLKDKIDEDKLEVAKMKSSMDELSAINLDLIPLKRPKSQASIDAEKEELRKLGESLRELDGISEDTILSNASAIRRKEAQISDLDSKVVSLNEKCNREHDLFMEAKNFLETVNDLQASQDVDDLRARVDGHAEEWESLRKTYNELDKELYGLKGKLRELDEQIDMGKKGFCNSCGQPVGEEHISKLMEDRERLESKISAHKGKMDAVGYDPQDKEGASLRKELKEAEDFYRKIEDTFKVQDDHWERLKEAESSLRDKEELRKSAQNELEALQNERTRLEGLTSQLEHKNELQAQYDALAEQIDTDISTLGAFREQKEQNERIKEKRAQRDERVQKLGESVNERTIEMNLNKTCVEILDKALPTYMLLKACSTLEGYINGVVGKLFPYLKVKLQSKGKGVEFYILTEFSDEKWVSAKLASGAQKAILNLSFSIAIAQIYGIRTILLDEVDASMNGKNSKLVYEFLTTIEGFDQVFFVSNRQESIEVAKENGATCYFVDHGEYELI